MPIDPVSDLPEPIEARDSEPDRVAMTAELDRVVTEELAELSPPCFD